MKLKYLTKKSPCSWQSHCFFVCLRIILLSVVYQSINQSIIILLDIVFFQSFNQSISQSINSSIHQIDSSFHTEKHIAFLWLNNMLLLAGAIPKKIHINLYAEEVGNDTNTRTCGIKITCIIWLFHLRSSLFTSWVFLHRKLCWIPPWVQPEGEVLEGDL